MCNLLNIYMSAKMKLTNWETFHWREITQVIIKMSINLISIKVKILQIE